jgi:hypothetical protein
LRPHIAFSRHTRRMTSGTDSVFFYVHHDGRLRRCGITGDALRLLAAGIGGASPTDTPQSIFRRHRAWIGALALLEHRERGGANTLVLTETDVRLQLACEAEDLPDVLCI